MRVAGGGEFGADAAENFVARDRVLGLPHDLSPVIRERAVKPAIDLRVRAGLVGTARGPEDVVADAFLDLPEGITMRLYVDGDFSSRRDVDFWFKLLRLRPDVQAYGYSKSWDELVGHEVVPANYILNLSGGGRERKVSKDAMRSLPMVRGEYIAVPVPQRFISMREARYDDPEYHEAVREAARALGHTKVFSCPGLCGQCVKGKNGQWTHACGDMRFQGVVIANGIH